MREHPYPERHRELVSIIKDYPSHDVAVDLSLSVGDIDFSDELESGSWDIQADSSPTWVLSCNLNGRLPMPEYLNAPVRMDIDIAGIVMPGFFGLASNPIGSREWSSSLAAYTPGGKLDDTTLDEYISYNYKTPQYVIRDAVYRAPYPRGQVRIQNFNTPRITRSAANAQNAPGFEDESSPMSILDSIKEEVGCVYFDTLSGGFRAIKDPSSLGSGGVWNYEADSAELLEPFEEPTWSLPGEQYTLVRARSKSDEPDDPPYVIKDWPVDYNLLRYKPVGNKTMYVPVTDRTLGGQTAARKLAFAEARKLRNGSWDGSITVAFNHLLEPFDVFILGEDYEDILGSHRRLWRCVITGISHQFDQTSISTILSYTAKILTQERVAPPRVDLGGISPGVIQAQVAP